MPKAWKEWEGRVVGEFRLEKYLGGSERGGVFETQYGPEALKAAVKLIPIGSWDPATVQAEFSRLQSARGLSHPHLLQIFECGRATLDDDEVIFVAMEYAEEDLSQILPNRPLTAAEIREMLKPTMDALGYLHGEGFVHGHLKPANVMANGDQLKLSSDGISQTGERRGRPGERGDYDAPEIAEGGNLPTADIWSLGMLLSTALTQHRPGWDAGREEPALPENVPAPFDEIIRHCVRRDPSARWTLAKIADRLGFGRPAHSAGVPQAEALQSAAASEAAVRPQPPTPQQGITPARRGVPHKRGANTGAFIAVAVVLVIVGIVVVPRLFRGGSMNSQTDATAHEQPPAPAETRESVNSAITQANNQGGEGEEPSSRNSPSADEKREDVPGAGRKIRRGLTVGHVAEQVLPDVPQSARDTIHGTVRVRVRVSVDSSGTVTEAELDFPGPSKYFAHLALDAAQRWKFEPPKMQGRNVLSDWLLHFRFTEKGTKVIPVQSDP